MSGITNKWAVRQDRITYICKTRPVYIKWAMGERINRWMVHDGSCWTPPGWQISTGLCSFAKELPAKIQARIRHALMGRKPHKAIVQLKAGLIQEMPEA